MERAKPLSLQEFRAQITNHTPEELEQRRISHRSGKRFGIGFAAVSTAVAFGIPVGVVALISNSEIARVAGIAVLGTGGLGAMGG
ncbi:MAG: hypothetical protein ACHQT7_02455, partial [Candidatus Levyibacteriota bacterium]